MKKESYERLILDITQFGAEDVIVTSDETTDPISGGSTPPAFVTAEYEMPIGF